MGVVGLIMTCLPDNMVSIILQVRTCSTVVLQLMETPLYWIINRLLDLGGGNWYDTA